MCVCVCRGGGGGERERGIFSFKAVPFTEEKQIILTVASHECVSVFKGIYFNFPKK